MHHEQRELNQQQMINRLARDFAGFEQIFTSLEDDGAKPLAEFKSFLGLDRVSADNRVVIAPAHKAAPELNS